MVSRKREIDELTRRVEMLEAALMHLGFSVARLDALHEGMELPAAAEHHNKQAIH